MSIAERKAREKAEREKHIMRTARQIATDQGWDAVTIRKLADEIEYSQPVIYAHFRNRDAIVAAVAVEGFGELATLLRSAAETSRNDRQALENVATAYIDFALGQSALYEAMLVLSTGLRFAQPDAPGELRDAFQALSRVVAPFCVDAETATETLWAALHGAAELERHGRIRSALRARRVEMIVQSLLTSEHTGPDA